MSKVIRYMVLSLWCAVLACPQLMAAQSKPAWQAPSQHTKHSLWPSVREHMALDHHTDDAMVQQYIRQWQQHPNDLHTILSQAAPYLQYIIGQTTERGLPAELALIPFVESKFEPFAVSHAGAVGLWQLMPGTATGQGLKINWWYDGRRDLITGTRAALDYLSYLYEFLNQDWLYAIVAYDAGQGTIFNAIKRNQQQKLPTDIWHLKLSKEATQYLPKLLAICAIIKDPQAYGLSLPTVSQQPYFNIIDIKQQIDIQQAATLADTPLLTLRYLNSGFKRWATDPLGPHQLLIPSRNTKVFIKNIKQLKQEHYTPWYHHVVNDGETLSGIAVQYHTHVNTLKQANHLASDLIKPGQDLLVPGTLKSIDSPKHTILHNTLTAQHLPGPKQHVHVVKHYDNLDSVAQRYGVTASQIYYWNHLSTKKLTPGQKLVLWLKHKVSTATKRNINYVVQVGDNLSTLAVRHGTTVKAIMTQNKLSTQRIRIGQKLILPT